MLAIQSPLSQYHDLDGLPLDGGFVYFGAPNQNPETNPAVVYWDAAGTQPAAQPVRTTNGYLSRTGSLAVVYANGDYSMTIRNRQGALVLYAPSATSFNNDVPFSAFISGLASSSGSNLAGFLQEGANATATTVQSKLRESKSLLDWMSPSLRALVRNRGPFDPTTRADLLTAVTNAWTDALSGKFDLWAPAGLYEIGEAHFPWRNSVNTSLLDAHDTTLWCDGPSTEFRTVSVNGADVFQCNALKNFHVRGYPLLTATISGTTSGSNGVSITNGGDNLDFEIHAFNLPGLDAGSLIDGGKALTIQPDTSSNELGRITARVIADGCAEAFGYEPHLVTSLAKKTAIDVHVTARNCFIAVKVVAAAATAALNTSMTSGVRVWGQALDCQKDVVVQRIHGVDEIDIEVITTKTAAARRLNPSGATWRAADTVVEALLVQYAHNARISVRGNKGECDYKARIGGSAAGLSGLTGATIDSVITVDIGGTAATADILELDFGGNVMRTSELNVSARTATTLPDAYYAGADLNRLRIGACHTGSFTGTLTGCTTAPTGTCKWSMNGDVVVLEIPALSATSNTTAASITGIPAAIRPVTAQSCTGVTINNSAASVSRIVVETGGTISLYTGASSTMTASGTKGLDFTTITYRRS